MPRKDAPTAPTSARAQQELVVDGIENYELPKALVTRIAKSSVPDSTKFSRETVLSLVKGSTVFMNYLGATAHDVALSKQHKSISPADVLKAIELIEFGDLVDMLQEELEVWREDHKADKVEKVEKVKRKATVVVPAGESVSKRRTTNGSAKTGLKVTIKPKAAAAAAAPPEVVPMDVDGTSSEPEYYAASRVDGDDGVSEAIVEDEDKGGPADAMTVDELEDPRPS